MFSVERHLLALQQAALGRERTCIQRPDSAKSRLYFLHEDEIRGSRF